MRSDSLVLAIRGYRYGRQRDAPVRGLKFRKQNMTDDFTAVLGHQRNHRIARPSQRINKIGFRRAVKRGGDHAPDGGNIIGGFIANDHVKFMTRRSGHVNVGRPRLFRNP